MAKKRCPFCGKRTTTAAMECRKCGAQLQELLLAEDPIMHTAKKRFSPAAAAKAFLYCLIVVSGAICGVAAMLPDRRSSYTPAMQAHGETGYRTTATDLYENYMAYEEGAKLTTGNSTIEISGVVKSVGHSLFDETEVVLDAGGDSKSVAVTIEPQQGVKSSAPVQGASVNIRCENMTRILGPPTGQGCRLL